VTRLRSSSASRHARPEPGIRRRIASRPLLPTTAFARCRSTLRTSSDAVSGEAGASKRPFPPPQRLFLYGTPSPGSSFLACLFSTAPSRPRARSAACSPPRDPFSGSQGGSTPATRCPHHLSGAPNSSSGLAPPRDFWIPPAHRSARFTIRETCLRRTPDLRSLPACGSFVTAADGSTFPVRCVPRGSLFREPLGTTSILLSNPPGVK
jgi:hypothetical protein